MRFFNTTFASSMTPDGVVEFSTLSPEKAAAWLGQEGFANAANPSHGNTLSALTRRLGIDLTAAKGGRVLLQEGDECLVSQIEGLPRETREFTDEEVAKATFSFRLVKMARKS